jgi:hypothetical protein
LLKLPLVVVVQETNTSGLGHGILPTTAVATDLPKLLRKLLRKLLNKLTRIINPLPTRSLKFGKK